MCVRVRERKIAQASDQGKERGEKANNDSEDSESVRAWNASHFCSLICKCRRNYARACTLKKSLRFVTTEKSNKRRSLHYIFHLTRAQTNEGDDLSLERASVQKSLRKKNVPS